MENLELVKEFLRTRRGYLKKGNDTVRLAIAKKHGKTA